MTSGISRLGGNDDNGFCIKSRYVTYGFGDQADRDKYQLGYGRLTFGYALTTIEGNGRFTITGWPEAMDFSDHPNPYPATQAPFDLSNPALDDVNVPLNITGNRAFYQFDATGPNCANWLLQRFNPGVTNDPRMQISGR